MLEHIRFASLAVLAPLLIRPAVAVDAAALELGRSGPDEYRIGVTAAWDWDRRWFENGDWALGGYWEVGASYWKTDADWAKNELIEIGLTPVLRWAHAGDRRATGPFVDVGIGAHLLSDVDFGSHRLSTSWQFGSLVGVGVRFGGHGEWELQYRFQHLSNADIKLPNGGADFHLLRLVRRL